MHDAVLARRVTRALVILIVVFAGLHALWYSPDVIDDAFITFRYARNLAAGLGFRFDPTGPMVEGFSNPTWTALCTLLIALRVPDLLQAVTVIGLLLHAGTALLVWWLAGGQPTWRGAAALVGPLYFACSPFAAYHAMTGLETPLYTALLASTGVAMLRLDRSRLTGVAFATGLVLVTLTRPEGFGYAIALLVTAAWLYRGRANPVVLASAIALLCTLAGITVWRLLFFHAIIANSALVKIGGPLKDGGALVGLAYVLKSFAPERVPIALVLYAAVASVLMRVRDRYSLALVAPIVCAAGFSVCARGDWMHSIRFMVPAMPFIAALVGRAAMYLADRPERRWRVAFAALLGGVCLLQLTIDIEHFDTRGFGVVRKPARWLLEIPQRIHAPVPARLAGVTHWAMDHVAPGQSLATGDIGFPGWATDADIIDLAGLTDATLARVVPAHDAGRYASYLKQRRPDWLVLRLANGRPTTPYDALTLESGILSEYVLADSVATYGAAAIARIYRHAGTTQIPTRAQVLARYERAIHWNPRVTELREWQSEAASRTLQVERSDSARPYERAADRAASNRWSTGGASWSRSSSKPIRSSSLSRAGTDSGAFAPGSRSPRPISGASVAAPMSRWASSTDSSSPARRCPACSEREHSCSTAISYSGT